MAMTHLVSKHSGKAIIVLADRQDPTKDEDLAVGEHEGIFLLALYDEYLPLGISVLRSGAPSPCKVVGIERALLLMGLSGSHDALGNTPHLLHTSVVCGQNLAAVLSHCLLKALLSQRLFLGDADVNEAQATRIGYTLQVHIVVDACTAYDDDKDGLCRAVITFAIAAVAAATATS